MPGHKVYLQDGGEIREGLKCCYCRLVLKDPVQTSESGLRLCKECYEKASKLVFLLIHSPYSWLLRYLNSVNAWF